MAERKFLFMAADGYSEEGATTDSTTLGGLTMGGNINMNSAGKVIGSNAATTDGDLLVYGQSSGNLAGLTIDTADLVMTNRKITSLDDGTAAGDAVNKGQLDAAVINGGTLKEALFSEDQLDNAEGFFALSALTFSVQPVSGDIITLTDGVTTRGYGATTGGDVQYTIGATALDTMENLAAAILGDGTWGSEVTQNHPDIGTNVLEIWELDNDAGESKVSGVWGTQANITYVDFTGELDYTKNATVTLPTSAPGNTNFGVRRTQASLTDGELHYILGYDTIWGWDGDANQWNQLSGLGSIPDATAGAGGGTKGKATYDSDKGMFVTSGIVSLNITADKGLQFNSGALEIEIDDTPDTLDADADGLKVVGVPSLFKINGSAVSANVTASNVDTLVAGAASDADALHTHDGKSDTSHTHTHASTTGQTTDDHHNQAHVLTGGDHTESGLTTGHILTATGATTFAWQAPGASQEAQRVENLMTAVETVAKADPVYHSSTADKFGKADAGTDAKAWVFGVAKAAIVADAAGEIVSYGPAAGVLVAATAGAKYYLADGGGLATSAPAAAKRVILIGWAINATDLWVQPIDMGKKAA